MQIGDQAPAEARAQAFFHPVEILRRFVGRNDDLPVAIDQRVEGMEKFFLRRVLAADELHIVDHQHIDRAELILERDGILETQRAHELIHEFFRRHIDDAAMRIILRMCQAIACIKWVLPKPTPP